MKIYVVVIESIKIGHRKVSQEAYKTLLSAHAFCLGRSGDVKKHNDYLFYDGEYRYEIVEITVV